MRVNRLHPHAEQLDADAALREVALRPVVAADRTHLAVNMVASVDGRVAVAGRSSPLTNRFDRALFHALRGGADAVLVGTRTLAAERYGPLVPDPERRRAREVRGLSPAPLACVVTRSGRLELTAPLFADPESEVVVFSGSPFDTTGARARVTVVRADPSDLEPTAVLCRLRDEHGVRVLLCEGGPTLNAALLAAGVVDELFLSIAPVLVGGRDALTLLAGELPRPAPFALRDALESEGALFLRYGVLAQRTASREAP